MKSFDLLFDDEFKKAQKLDNKISEFLYKKEPEELLNYLRSQEVEWLDVDGYMITLAIANFTANDLNDLNKYLDVIKLQEDVKDVRIITNEKYNVSELIIEKEDYTIDVLPFSKVVPDSLEKIPTLESEQTRAGNCFEINKTISLNLGIKNDYIIGYTYGYTDKSKHLHSWIKTKLDKKDVVISGRFNDIINQTGFYNLRHAEELNVISSEDLKNDINEYLSKIGTFPDTAYYTFRDEIINDLKENDEIFNKKGK